MSLHSDNVSLSDLSEPENIPSKKENASDKKLSIERIYQKKTQLEHILLRPDTYIGSAQKLTQNQWVLDQESNTMVCREITYCPGLYKIFDEILVNAADNKIRDSKMSLIKVDIKPEENMIRIWNNGQGIPVTQHKVEKMFVPTLIFGHLLTSSNYNDEDKKVTGGRNGYGAKLANIFSNKFIVETSNKQYGKSFKQTWIENMSKTSDPITKSASDSDFTCVTFYPDLARFGLESLDQDHVDLFVRRAYDTAATTRGVTVQVNGKRIPVKNFKDYVELYTKDKNDEFTEQPLKVIHEVCNDRWEIAVAPSTSGFQQVSFVNSIATTKGGNHVTLVADQIAGRLVDVVKKKSGKQSVTNVKSGQIKNHMWLFLNCLIENPAFDSQTKENMTLVAKNFGSTCTVSEKFISQAVKCGIVESVMNWLNFKTQNMLDKQCHGKKQTRLKGIVKLEDANHAGSAKSGNCTLILTEGDSAKTLAVAGLSVVGRDTYGVFPLRGKLLNVREASSKQIMENAEINNIIKIIGLQYKNKYETMDTLKSLRYGRMMIMTDQDQDGSHIKGLLINFIHTNWPSLLRHNFVEEFITPIVKVFKGKMEKSFYSIPEFIEWQNQTPNYHTWRTKYYKGLGTSTSKEAKEYFNDLARHRIRFRYQGQEDDQSIVLAFGKNADARKDWLTSWMDEKRRRNEMGLAQQYLYGKETTAVSYTDFINQELILFSNMDNERSIPSIVDGFKPGQRKVLFTCLRRNITKEIKVAQLAGSVSEMSAYHHGEASLVGTIVGLAQDFVGSNNLNLLLPLGQFGTRLHGGKDSASPRYIYTALSPLTKFIFHPDDQAILKHLYDDGQRIEPEHYLPIIPMVLINGAEGIGTGWSTKVPNHSIEDIVANLKRMIRGEEPEHMLPSYKGFRGTIFEIASNRYQVNGEMALLDNGWLEITELPIKTWAQNYKENVLEPFLSGTEKIKACISDYKEYHTDTTVRFTVKMNPEQLSAARSVGFYKFFKLQSLLSSTNVVLFDEMGCIRKFDGVIPILKQFFTYRATWYSKRKNFLEAMLSAEALKLQNQARFVLEITESKLIVYKKPKKVLIQLLLTQKYDSDPVRSLKELLDKEGAEHDRKVELERQEELEQRGNALAPSNEEEESASGPDYNYLLNMPIWSLTKERMEELLKQRDKREGELKTLKAKTHLQLWDEDLERLMAEIKKLEVSAKKDGNEDSSSEVKIKGKKGKKNIQISKDSMPSDFGERIEPVLDAEMVKKIQDGQVRAVKAKTTQKQRQMMKEFVENGAEKQEKNNADAPESAFDLLEAEGITIPDELKQFQPVRTVAPKRTMSTKAAKQSKITTVFKKAQSDNSISPKERKPRGRKKRVISESSAEESDMEDSDVAFCIDDDVVSRRCVEKRGATKKKYTFSDDSEESEQQSDSVVEFKPVDHGQGDKRIDVAAIEGVCKPVVEKARKPRKPKMPKIRAPQKEKAAKVGKKSKKETMQSSSDDSVQLVRRESPKRKVAQKAKFIVNSDSEDDDSEEISTKRRRPKLMSSSDDEYQP